MHLLRIPAALLLVCLSVSAALALPKVGVGVATITPSLDEQMAGYYYERTADGKHDDLFAKALLIDDGQQRVALVACDLILMPKAAAVEARQRIAQRLGLPASHVLMSSTHSHTGPQLQGNYVGWLAQKITDSVITASGNARPSRLSVGVGMEPSLAHNRRYLMKDGTTVTNPGFLNPSIVRTQGPIDPQVPVFVVEDENGKRTATWVNYAMHLDTVGGTWISADYPYYLCRKLAEVSGPDMVSIFTIGAAGNINHWDVKRPGPQRGQEEARRLGEVLSGEVIKTYTRLTPLAGTIRVAGISDTVDLPVPAISDEQMQAAKRIMATPAEKGVDFTLERVNALRTLLVGGQGGAPLKAEIQVIAVGEIAFVAVPGELFVELGLSIQQQSPFPHTFIVEQANDSIGYIPTKEAFAQGGYEPTSARFSPGGGELIVTKAVELLKRLRAQVASAIPKG